MTVISSPRLSATRAVRQVNRKLRTDWRPANDRLHRTASPDPHATLGAARGIRPRTPAISPAFSPTCTLHPTARCMRRTIRHYCLDRSPARCTTCCGREFAAMPRCAHRAGVPAAVLASRRITNRLLLCALLCLASTLAVSPVNADEETRGWIDRILDLFDRPDNEAADMTDRGTPADARATPSINDIPCGHSDGRARRSRGSAAPAGTGFGGISRASPGNDAIECVSGRPGHRR